jgi:hypothetical protein
MKATLLFGLGVIVIFVSLYLYDEWSERKRNPVRKRRKMPKTWKVIK